MKKITLKKQSLHLVPKDESQFAIDYKNELNEAQYDAVTSIDGPALVIAGAGTGKTRTLTYRVARLIEMGIAPESILLLTFTRKAAREMLQRAAVLLDERTERVSGGTFHSFANRVLRQYGAVLEYGSNFTILDQGDAEDVINVLRTRMGLASKHKRFPKKQTLLKMYSASINTLTPLSQVIAADYPQFSEVEDAIHELVKGYIGYKRQNNAMDYDDLLVNLVSLLEKHEDIRRKLYSKYKYIMVDEYQDTNALQAKIVQLLGGEKGNVMVVGDDSQSIYAFRGANFRNIMDFPRQFAGAKTITLEENYRSTQPILDLTNRIIESAIEKYSKTLFTTRGEGETPMLIATEDENTQSRYIVQQVLELREEGIPLQEMAVLFRAGFQSFDLEIELTKANVPFRKFGGLKLMETAHIKDVIAHLRVVENPKDIISWTRILLLLDGVGPVTAERFTDEVLAGANPFSPASDSRLAQVASSAAITRMLELLRDIAREALGIGDKVQALLEYYHPILKDNYDDFQKRWRDLETLQTIAERYRSLSSFLTDMALEPPNESVEDISPESRDDEYLTLSTIHSAKGLEWHSVFVIHLLDGRFPLTSAAESTEAMEEERRLFYVACTRAKRRLFLTFPTTAYDRASGTILSKPSRFLDGIPEQLLDQYSVEED
ncbi:MAG: ATP-dependent DNA helicase [Ectothiorhodospiraceae bacterium]|nr:ATP-dependent DNA helicase [Ectothiorhodospiraceae bacterium]